MFENLAAKIRALPCWAPNVEPCLQSAHKQGLEDAAVLAEKWEADLAKLPARNAFLNVKWQEAKQRAERLAEIDAAAKADADDLAKMRDGTKMTRAGLVSVIVYQQQDMREAAAALREAIAVCDEAYEATGYSKVAKSSHQRIRLEEAARRLELYIPTQPTKTVPVQDTASM